MTDIEKWICMLVGFVAAYRKPSDGKVLGPHLTQLIPGTEKYWKEVDVGRLQVQELIKLVQAGKTGLKSEPTKVYAAKLAALYKQMRPHLSEFYMSPEISEAQVKIVKPAIALLKYDPTVAAKREAALDVNLHMLPDRLIRQLFVTSTKQLPSQSNALEEVKMLIKAWTGKPGTTLPRAVADKIKAKDPERYKHFLKLNKSMSDTYKTVVRHLVRDAGKPLPIKTIVEGLKAAGATEKSPYAQFIKMPLLVGEDGLLRTLKNNYMKILPPLGSEVKYNEKYDPVADNKYVMLYRPPNTTLAPGKWKAIYTRRLLLTRKGGRVDKIDQNIDKVPKQRNKWIADLKGRDPTKQVLAAITECLYQHAARIGGKGNTKGKETFGFTTVNMAHVKKTGSGYIITYPGKDAIQQKHVIDSKVPESDTIIKIMDRLAKGKSKNDKFWTINGRPVVAGMIRDYMKGIGIELTPHKFRNVRGTKLMKDLLDNAKIPKDSNQMQVEKIVKGLAVKVGELLGHVSGDKVTAGTSIKSYINPSVFSNFFSARGLRVPQWVPKTSNDD